jgi:hypothetical protein
VAVAVKFVLQAAFILVLTSERVMSPFPSGINVIVGTFSSHFAQNSRGVFVPTGIVVIAVPVRFALLNHPSNR